MVDIFSKYVMKDENKSEVFHSSAYGQAQNGASMGAASTESFATRREQDGSRQFIRGYSDSKVASSTFSPAARPIKADPSTIPSSRVMPGSTAARGASPMRGAPAAPRQGMSRPPMPRNPGIHR